MQTVKWTNEELLAALSEFYELYSRRPIKDNSGGMKSPHMFPAWYIVKTLKPKFLIESGVWKGLGTWFFNQASPSSYIISIDPEPRFREITLPGVTYQTEDFLETNWSDIQNSDVLVFFDDHQNCMPRLKRCKELGFNKIIFEDNYPWQQGDCYTPKKILADRDFTISFQGQQVLVPKRPGDLEWFKENVALYQEMPPIFKDEKTRWGDAWDENYPTPVALFSSLNDIDFALVSELFARNFIPEDIVPDSDPNRVYFKPVPEFELTNECLDYTWLAYLELMRLPQ